MQRKVRDESLIKLFTHILKSRGQKGREGEKVSICLVACTKDFTRARDRILDALSSFRLRIVSS